MIKKFTANCEANGRQVPVTLYVGNPATGNHPLNFQNRWLSDTKGVMVPINIMRSFSKLVEISEKHRVPFEDLCGYVIEELKATNSIKEDAEGASGLSNKNNDAAKEAAKNVAKEAKNDVAKDDTKKDDKKL
jgi:hypothetical protein